MMMMPPREHSDAEPLGLRRAPGLQPGPGCSVLRSRHVSAPLCSPTLSYDLDLLHFVGGMGLGVVVGPSTPGAGMMPGEWSRSSQYAELIDCSSASSFSWASLSSRDAPSWLDKDIT